MKSVILMKNVSVHYGNMPALMDVDLEVKEGEYLGIIGPNGGGKSTLLKAILGIVPITKGKVEVFGAKVREHGDAIGYVPQSSNANRKFPISVLEVVLTGRTKNKISPFYKYSKEDKEIADEQLKLVGLKEYGNRLIEELSGGEFQKVLIARALTVNPKLLILDEPTANVDTKSREEIYDLLERLNKNKTILMVTHDMMAIASNVKSLACLNRSLVYHGEPALTPKAVKELYGCPIDLIAHGIPHRVLGDHNLGEIRK